MLPLFGRRFANVKDEDGDWESLKRELQAAERAHFAWLYGLTTIMVRHGVRSARKSGGKHADLRKKIAFRSEKFWRAQLIHRAVNNCSWCKCLSRKDSWELCTNDSQVSDFVQFMQDFC
jgi:hypothetical protein